MRLFLAFPLPGAQCDALTRLAEPLPGWRWSAPQTLHLTLAFLGDVAQTEAEELHDALDRLSIPPVQISLRGIGHFGRETPRAVWVGVANSAPLADLAGRLVRAARGAGITVERRRFAPHVTLARLNASASAEDVARFAERHAGLSLPPFTPRAVTLFRSHLRPEGPVHEELARYPDVTGGWPQAGP